VKLLDRLEDVTPDPENANDGTLRGQQLLERSLEGHGAARSILVDRNGVCISGNKTLEAAVDHGMGVTVVETDGETLVVVQRTDLDLNDPKTRELVYLDNRSAELGLKWNPEQLERDLSRGIELGGMFTSDETEGILQHLNESEVRTRVHFDTLAQYHQFLHLVALVEKTVAGEHFGVKFHHWLGEQIAKLDPAYELTEAQS